MGLGNPGTRYELTRHNAGFLVVDRLAQRWGITVGRRRCRAHVGEANLSGRKIVLAKPYTYMNRSGESVLPLLQWYKIPLDNMLLIYDELALPFGTLRLRARGSAGGHNGVASVIAHVGDAAFPRLRLGIGPAPPYMAAADYVLAPFSREEIGDFRDLVDQAADAAATWLELGLQEAMNRHNMRAGPSDQPPE